MKTKLMREIKFRGMTKHGTWLYGFVMIWATNTQIWENTQEANNFLVLKDTIGQFTGLKDKNNNEIYEGDIISNNTGTGEKIYWCDKKGAWMIDKSKYQDKSDGQLLSEALTQFDYQISGNIHQQEKRTR